MSRCEQTALDRHNAVTIGWIDGLANRHDAAVHAYAVKPHWYHVPACWRLYFASWRRGQEAYKEGRRVA